MIGKTKIFDRDVIGAASRFMGNDNVQRTALLMSRLSGVEHEPVAVDQQTKLIGVRVVDAVQANVEIADNVDRLVVR